MSYRNPEFLRDHIANIILFYHPTCIDNEFGGYINQLRDDGSVYDRMTKHLVGTCRFIYNLALDQRNLSRDPNPVPTLLEMWEKRVADKLAGVKPERKERNFEEERKQEVVHKNINYGFQSPQMTVRTRLRNESSATRICVADIC